MAELTLKNINKHYFSKTIIEDFNLEVKEGEFIVIVGPSGCGKSTLLRCIAGLETVSSGDIIIDSEKVNLKEPKDRNIAMVFQNYALYPHMSVYNNLAYGLKHRKLNKNEIRARVENAAKILGLSELLDRKPKQLSGGQRQRVAMGRAMVRQPKLFLFDEPLSNLDANLRSQMRFEIRKLQQQFKTTSIYVTHDQVEAMTLADRIVVMNQGKVEQVGVPQEIYHKPLTQFVAGFMGSPPMNFIKAKCNGTGTKVLLNGGTSLPLANEVKANDCDIILGVRPENISKADKVGADVFNIAVNHIEALGAEQLIYGYFPGDKQQLILKLPNKVNAQIGEELILGLMPESLHIFNANTGARLN